MSPFLGLRHRAAGRWRLIGWALQRVVLERSARGGVLVPLLTTFGLAIVIDNLLFEQFGADTRSLAPYIGDLSYDSWTLAGRHLSSASSPCSPSRSRSLLLGGLQLFLSRTAIGRAIRATAEDPDTAGLVGVNARPRQRDRRRDRHGDGRRSPASSSACARPSTRMPARRSCIFAFEAVGDRRRRLAVGHAGRRHRARRRADVWRAGRSARLPHRRPPRLPGRAVRAAVLRRPRPARPDGARRERAS